ncbi:MAG: hypothetical protein NTY81_01600 [Candidatus Staskawiczbacteria bacterium]|nr:hypothetical protein [Candidatus Staskawiczbacteria bacterium]
MLSCIIFKSGVSKGIEFAWLENKVLALALLVSLKKGLKNTIWLLIKLPAFAELSQDAYIAENKTTETNPK